MSLELQAESASASRSAKRRRFGWRTPVRWFGFGCLMGASFFAGYVVWLLWGTGLSTERAQQQLRAGVERSFDHPKPIAEAPRPDEPSRIPLGDAYAEIQIPSIGLDMIVVQGTDYDSLKQGPGHYLDTADPWDLAGRVGIAGHRTTYLHPFFNLDQVQPGDAITLRTAYGRFDYTVTRNFVLPEETAGVVLDQTAQPTLVLTTCNPKYASSQRLIVEADLTGSPSP